MQKFIKTIKKEDDATKDSECLLLDAGLSKDFIQKLKSSSEDKILLSVDANMCKELDLDGAIIDLSKSENVKKDFAIFKEIVGKGKFIGAITRNRRHEAMLISEQEPDFIIFKAWKDGLENVKELLDWYNDLFLIQSAVMLEDEGIDYKSLNADIVII